MKNKKTALIDADSLIYYEMGKETLDLALEGIDSRMNQMMEVTGADSYAAFLTQGKCFRYNVAKNRPYKGNRKCGDKPIIFPAIKEYLKQEWNGVVIPQLEADDLVSVYHNENTVICSPDKDVLYQNVGRHYNYGKAELITVTEAEAERFLWKQVLMGDSTDGIEGIPKVGPKTANTWLNELSEDPRYGTMSEFVLKKYVETFGISNGIDKFAETFKLIYILKSLKDVLRETGIELPELVTYDVKSQNKNEWL